MSQSQRPIMEVIWRRNVAMVDSPLCGGQKRERWKKGRGLGWWAMTHLVRRKATVSRTFELTETLLLSVYTSELYECEARG